MCFGGRFFCPPESFLQTLPHVRAPGASPGPWIVIDGEVYDVTVWQTAHPGGAGILTGRRPLPGDRPPVLFLTSPFTIHPSFVLIFFFSSVSYSAGSSSFLVYPYRLTPPPPPAPPSPRLLPLQLPPGPEGLRGPGRLPGVRAAPPLGGRLRPPQRPPRRHRAGLHSPHRAAPGPPPRHHTGAAESLFDSHPLAPSSHIVFLNILCNTKERNRGLAES